MPDLIDILAEMPGTAQRNLPAVVQPAVWAPERLVTFRGHHATLTVWLPVRRADTDPFSEGFRDQLATAWATRDAGLVWDLIEKAGIR